MDAPPLRPGESPNLCCERNPTHDCTCAKSEYHPAGLNDIWQSGFENAVRAAVDWGKVQWLTAVAEMMENGFEALDEIQLRVCKCEVQDT